MKDEALRDAGYFRLARSLRQHVGTYGRIQRTLNITESTLNTQKKARRARRRLVRRSNLLRTRRHKKTLLPLSKLMSLKRVPRQQVVRKIRERRSRKTSPRRSPRINPKRSLRTSQKEAPMTRRSKTLPTSKRRTRKTSNPRSLLDRKESRSQIPRRARLKTRTAP